MIGPRAQSPTMNVRLATSPRKVALVTAPCSVCDSYQHGTRECPHQPEEVLAMYQQGPSQFPKRFDNRFRTRNYFQNQSFNNQLLKDKTLLQPKLTLNSSLGSLKNPKLELRRDSMILGNGSIFFLRRWT